MKKSEINLIFAIIFGLAWIWCARLGFNKLLLVFGTCQVAFVGKAFYYILKENQNKH